MSDIVEKAYSGRDNSLRFELKKNGITLTEQAITDITEVQIYFQGAYYSSIGDFVLIKDGTNGTIELAVGVLPIGKDTKTELIIFDDTHTNGIVWDIFSLTISDEAVPVL